MNTGHISHPPTAATRLLQRGIADSARAAGWQAATYKHQSGWRYPVYDLDGTILHTDSGKPVLRFKNADSSARMKYSWPNGKGDARYYLLPGAHQAIVRAGGQVVIASGEPDLLALRAAGIDNTLCWFGENSIPPTLADDLQSMGVTRVTLTPDRDSAGVQAAAKVVYLLAGSGIVVEVRQLPGELGSKYDLNRLWIDCQFNSVQFRQQLDSLSIITDTLPAPQTARPEPHEHTRPVPADNLALHANGLPQAFMDELIRSVETATGIARYKSTGWSVKPVLCPFHEDTHPSAGFNRESGVIHCFVCGSHNAKQVGEHFSLRLADYYPPRQKHDFHDADLEAAARDQTHVTRVNLPYTSDVSPDLLFRTPAQLIRAGIGTGKTELARRVIARMEAETGHEIRVLNIIHRRALSVNTAARLGLTDYQGLESGQLRSAARLSISVDSLHKLKAAGRPLPYYDLVILDEIEQVLAHLDGGTLRDGRAAEALNIMWHLVRSAGRVLAMDAHAGKLAYHWLCAVCDTERVSVLVNDYRKPRGILNVWMRRETAIDQAHRMIEERAGPVVIATGSRLEAKTLGALFRQRYGQQAVMVVHGDNSLSQAAQHFVNHINDELPRYRLLVCSPTLETGIDITAPVAGVIGIFNHQPLAAANCHQMLGRYRSARELHVYVQQAESRAETDENAIFSRHLQNARETRQECFRINAEGIEELYAEQERLLRLQSRVQAMRAISMNHLHEHFIALAGEYRVVYHGGEKPELREELKAARQAVRSHEKRLVLTCEPVSQVEYESAITAGEQTPELQAGRVRDIIESIYGQTITSTIYDHYRKGGGSALRLFAALEQTPEKMLALDRGEIAAAVPYSRRTHWHRKRSLFDDLRRTVFAGQWHTDLLDTDTIAARIDDFITRRGDEMRRYLGWRRDNSQKPVAALRWLLNRVGIKLETSKVQRKGDRRLYYHLDAQTLEQMRRYTVSRLSYLHALELMAEDMKPAGVNRTNLSKTCGKRLSIHQISDTAPVNVEGAGQGSAAPDYPAEVAAPLSARMTGSVPIE